MERDQILSILESLAEGQPEFVVEALTVAMTAVRGRPHLASAGLPWTAEEEARLCAEFDAGMTVADIARQHARSRGAITSRLVKCGRLDADRVVSRDRGARVVA